MEEPRQLSFDLPLDPRYGREDFLVSAANEQAYALVEAWPDWPHPALVLTGPAGSGKSHLASIWATRAHAWTVPASAVTMDEVPHLVSNGALVVEDADRASPRDEAALFHLLNVAAELAAPVVLTARRGVEGWGVATRDLLSRLRLAPSAALGAPDEALLRAVLVKLFVDRQLVVDLMVVEALVRRLDRSIARAQEVVARLDRDALSRGRRITRPLALALLDRHETDAESDEEGEGVASPGGEDAAGGDSGASMR